MDAFILLIRLSAVVAAWLGVWAIAAQGILTNHHGLGGELWETRRGLVQEGLSVLQFRARSRRYRDAEATLTDDDREALRFHNKSVNVWAALFTATFWLAFATTLDQLAALND